MNTAQYIPVTVWQGGRPGCLPSMAPIPQKVVVKRVIGPLKTCEHCGAEFSKRTHEAHREFKTRKFCHMDCAYAHRNKARQDRMNMVMDCLPGTKNDVMNKISLTRAELERIMIYLVAGKMVVSAHNGPDGRIFRKVEP